MTGNHCPLKEKNKSNCWKHGGNLGSYSMAINTERQKVRENYLKIGLRNLSQLFQALPARSTTPTLKRGFQLTPMLRCGVKP